MATDEEKGLLAGTNLHPADIVVIILYFVIVLGFGLWSSLRNRGSVGGYFLAGRSMHWIPVGASLFASNIGSGHFIGLAGSGAATGIGIACFELNAMFILLILGWIFVPVYVAAGVFTMPEYLRKRFGGQRIRIYLSVLAIILSIFTKVAADLFAGATFIEQSLSWDLYASIVLLLAIAALFTIAGGLTAVIWTDFIQTIIMLIGAAALMVKGFVTIGGYEMVKYKFMRAVPNTTLYAEPSTECGRPPHNSFHFFRSVDDPVYPWTGAIFGVTISSVWYWCSDQVIVQRTLAAKNLSHAKAGTVLAGYLKVLPMWLLVLPGMMARILFPDTVGCSDAAECLEVCGTAAGCTNIAYPMLVLKLMPDGARGMMLAVMIAALMSSLTSIFNSSSTIFTMDIWRRIHKDANDVELMIVGRVFVLVMVGIGIAWIPIVKNFSELFVYIQSITSYLAPPICAVYVLAVLWKRTNEQGAFWSLMIGLVVGLVRFIWEFSYTVPGCGQGDDPRPDIISKVHYLHFGIILFAITFITCIIISILTQPIDDKYLHRLTFWDRHSKKKRIDIDQEELDKRREQHGDINPGFELEDHHSKKNRIDIDQEEVDKWREAENPQQHGHDNSSMEGEENLPCWKKSLQWICGIEKQEESKLTEEEKRHLEEEQTSLYEVPKWKHIVDANAIMLMFVAIFLWGFFY